MKTSREANQAARKICRIVEHYTAVNLTMTACADIIAEVQVAIDAAIAQRDAAGKERK